MRSITNKIALMLIVALIVSFAAISAVSYYTAQSKVVQLVSQNQAQILKDVDAVTDSFFHDYMEVAKKIAVAVGNTDNDGDAYMAQLKFQKYNANSLISFVFFGREDDGYFFQSDDTRLTPEKDNYDPRKRGWYMDAKAKNGAIYTEPYKPATYNGLVVSFAAPVTKNGKFMGVIGFDIQIDALSKKILDMGKTEYGYVYVMNKDGLILIHSDPSNVGKTVPASKYLAEEYAAKRFDENGLIPYVNYKGENVTAKLIPINEQGWLVVAAIGADTFSSNGVYRRSFVVCLCTA